MLPHIVRACALAFAILLTAGAPLASAQATDPDHLPIGWFAVDARGAWVTLPDDPALAEFLDVPQENLATRGLGLIVGAHVYPVRLGRWVALGFGGELLFSRGSRTLSPDDDESEEGVVDAPTVKARLSAVSPQFSLNFGGRDGWSYLSGGIGWSGFTSEVLAETAAGSISTGDAPRTSTINYGGGARWFMKEHLAFVLDLRFYTIRPQEATPTRPALQRQRLLTLSAGVSFK
jgi:hypothetical protein